MNPLDAFKHEIDKAKAEILRQVQIELLQETAKVTLSRLITLDPSHSTLYQECVRMMP